MRALLPRLAPIALLLSAMSMTMTACRHESNEVRQARADSTSQTNVMDRLYSQHLADIPEVKAKSDFFVEQYRTNVMTRPQAAAAFETWLNDYVDKNPDKVKAVQSGRPIGTPMAPVVPPDAPPVKP